MAQDINSTKTIWAIGRNYSQHAKEMGAPPPEQPVVFLKSAATLSTGEQFHLPEWSNEVHHEIELAVRLADDLKPGHVALALDLTARDRQSELKKKGLPWALAKSFPESCPISDFIPFRGNEWFGELGFELAVNQQTRQKGQVNEMIFPLNEILSYLDKHFPLRPGDLILTGTPEGVGPLRKGDLLQGQIFGELRQSWRIC